MRDLDTGHTYFLKEADLDRLTKDPSRQWRNSYKQMAVPYSTAELAMAYSQLHHQIQQDSRLHRSSPAIGARRNTEQSVASSTQQRQPSNTKPQRQSFSKSMLDQSMDEPVSHDDDYDEESKHSSD